MSTARCESNFPVVLLHFSTYSSIHSQKLISPIQVTTRRNSKFSPFSSLFNRSGGNSGGAQGSGGGGGGGIVTATAEDAAPPSIDNKDNLELLGDGIDSEPRLVASLTVFLLAQVSNSSFSLVGKAIGSFGHLLFTCWPLLSATSSSQKS